MWVDESGPNPQGALSFDVALPRARPYRLAMVGGTFDFLDVDYRSSLELVLRLADRAEVLVTATTTRPTSRPDLLADRRRVIEQFVDKLGCRERVRIATVSEPVEMCEMIAGLDLVVAEMAQLEWLSDCNTRRKKNGLPGFDVLCLSRFDSPVPPLRQSRRPFRLVSVGGTFNRFHRGHREYLQSALRLADRVHVLIAGGGYARQRKEYTPRRLEARKHALQRFFEGLGCSHRVDIVVLRDVAQLQTFVETCPQLDVVLAEQLYVGWFDKWNERRTQVGLTPYAIVCRSRTSLGGLDFSSSLWSNVPASPPARSEPDLFSSSAGKPGYGSQGLGKIRSTADERTPSN